MRIFKRLISLVLSAVFLTSFCLSGASCKKRASVKKTVSETDPWYNSTRVVLDPKFSSNKYEAVYPNGPWMFHDRYLMQYFTMNKIDPSKDISSQESVSSLVGIFDGTGNLIRMIDLQEIISQIGSPFSINVLSFSEGEKGFCIYLSRMDALEAYSCEIDPDTGLMIGSIREIDFTPVLKEEKAEAEKNNEKYMIKDYVSYVKVIEGYEVFAISNGSGGQDSIIVSKDGKALYRVDFEKTLGPGELKFVKDFFGGGNGTVLINGVGRTQVMASIDLKTGKASKITEGKPISDNQRISSTTDGRGYLTKATGIYSFDVSTGQEICSLDFDNCSINRYESQKSSVLSMDENKVILGFFEPINSVYSLSVPAVVYTLEKAQKNPHAGKKVLTVASLGDSLTYYEGTALLAFNDQQADYYAKLVLYDQSEYLSAGETTEDIDATDQRLYNAMSMVSGSLISDIRSGTGPDVIFGAAGTIDVLDDDYLLDLNEYLESGSFSASSCYTNLFGAAKIDGKTFFIPTSFTLSGIVTDGSALPAEQKGFTYEQYVSFVNDQCNGTEPVTEDISRMHFFNLCFQRNYAMWCKGKATDFDQEGFRKLSEFFKNSIPKGVSVSPNADETQMEMIGIPPEEKDAYFLEKIDSVASLAHINYFGDKIRILGLPSEDGTGPSASITTSFSITKGCAVKEGAYALLDTLLREDIQKEIRSAIPVNRAAVTYKVEVEKENNRKGYTSQKENPNALFSPDIMREGSLFVPDSKLPDIFLQAIEEVSTIFLSDNSVMMIVSEELPGFFLGQKDLNTVIATINNRTKTVFNER